MKTVKKIDSPENIILKRKNRVLNKMFFTDLIKKILLLAIFVFVIFNYIFGIKIMPNRDMSPMVGPSDLLIYYRLEKNYAAEEVVIIDNNDKEYVLRIVAVGGDLVDINEIGLNINGANQANSNIYSKTGMYEDGIDFPVKLKEDEIFVLGDLRGGAVDSRYFGPIKKSDIKGKVFILLRRTKF